MNSKKESPETYTIFLVSSTNASALNLIKPLPYTNTNNITWRVNYDDLFNGRQELFEFCRVRYQLVNGSITGLTLNDNQGYISANFPTDFNAQTTNGCILGIIACQENPIVAGTPGVFIVEGQNDIGVDINHKQLTGVQPLNIQWINSSGNPMNIFTQNYSIELMFEFYNV
jgi:hypothetical protein